MKKSIKNITAVTLILAFGGLSAFAQENTEAQKDGESPKSMEAPEDLKDRQPPKLDEITGRIKISGKKDNKIITIKTNDGSLYTITLADMMCKGDKKGPDMDGKEIPDRPKGDRPDDMHRPDGRERPDMSPKDMANDDRRQDRKNGPMGGKTDEKKLPRRITIKDLEAVKGKEVTLVGLLNKETSIFMVFDLKR